MNAISRQKAKAIKEITKLAYNPKKKSAKYPGTNLALLDKGRLTIEAGEAQMIYVKGDGNNPYSSGSFTEGAYITKLRVVFNDIIKLHAPAVLTIDDALEMLFTYKEFETIENNEGIMITSPTDKSLFWRDEPSLFPKDTVTSDIYHVLRTLTDQDVKNIEIAKRFASDDDLRPVLTEVCFSHKGFIAATDAHVMYFEPIDNVPTFDIMLSAKAFKIIKAMHSTNDPVVISGSGRMPATKKDQKDEDDLLAYLEDGQLKENRRFGTRQGYWKFENSLATVYLYKPGNMFPDFRSVIPIDNPHSFTTNRLELIEGLKKCLPNSNLETDVVAFNIDINKIVLHSEDINRSVEHFEEIRPERIIGAEMGIAFNINLLLGVLKLCEGQAVTFSYSVHNRAAIINGNMLIMPVMWNS